MHVRAGRDGARDSENGVDRATGARSLAQNRDWYADAPSRRVIWPAAVEGARFATMTEAGILAKVGVSTFGVAAGQPCERAFLSYVI